MPILSNKDKYALHYRNLHLYLQLGLQLKISKSIPTLILEKGKI